MDLSKTTRIRRDSHDGGNSVASVSLKDDGGVQVDIGEASVEIHGTTEGDIDINIKKQKEQDDDSKVLDSLTDRLDNLEALLDSHSNPATPRSSAGVSEPREASLLGSNTRDVSESREVSENLEERMDRLDELLRRTEGGQYEGEITPTKQYYDESGSDIFPRSPLEENHQYPAADAWLRTSRALERAGFNAIPVNASGVPDPNSLYSEVRAVLSQYERRGTMIEEFSRYESSDASAKESSRKLEEATRMVNTLRRKLDIASNKVTTLEQDAKRVEKGESEALRKLRRDNAALHQKLTLSEHRVKAKESVCERLQEKLEQQVKRSDKQREKARSAFESIEKRSPRPRSGGDQEVLEVVRALQSQNEELENELDVLKSQNRQLNEALRDHENALSGSKEASLTAKENALLAKAHNLEAEQEASRQAMEDRERAVVTKLAKLEQELIDAQAEKVGLLSHIENLKMELSSRPTMRDWKACQRQISKLELQLHTAVEALEAEELQDARENGIYALPRNGRAGARHMGLSARERVELLASRAQQEQVENKRKASTIELIRRDKQVHRLGLDKLTAIPKSTAHQILQEVCRILELSDVDMISPALQKLCWVVRAMPKMEQFVKQVSSFVLLHADPKVNQNQADPDTLLKSVLDQLKLWTSDMHKLISLTDFRKRVTDELERVPQLAPEGDAEPSAAPQDWSNDQLILRLQSLVKLEKDMLRHRSALKGAEAYMESHPEALVSRIVAHFQQLFNVRSMEGVFPKLNQVYVELSETSNFLQVLRPTLGLSPRASVHACLAKVQEIALQNDLGGSKQQVPDVETAVATDSSTVTPNRKEFYLPQWKDDSP